MIITELCIGDLCRRSVTSSYIIFQHIVAEEIGIVVGKQSGGQGGPNYTVWFPTLGRICNNIFPHELVGI